MMKNPLTVPMLFSFLLALSANAQQGAFPGPPTGPTTQMTFDDDEFEFGQVEQGGKVEHIFRFTNTGNRLLVISNAKGSCGCTVPSWPKEPIGPGGTGAIVVQFDSKGKMGKQSKMVTITANTDPAQTMLKIKGEIYEAASSAKSDVKKVEGATKNFTVFPNPTKGQVSLKIADAKGQAAYIEIFDSNGQLVKKLQVKDAGASPISMDASTYANGQYWMSVQLGDQERVNLPFVVAK